METASVTACDGVNPTQLSGQHQYSSITLQKLSAEIGFAFVETSESHLLET